MYHNLLFLLKEFPTNFLPPGDQPVEATATMKYNRNRNVFTTQIEIPDFDVEAGVKVGMTDSISKGKSITFEISNKNVPQLSLIGRAKWVVTHKT